MSDIRLKNEIQTIPGSKYVKLGLRGVSWVWNTLANEIGLSGRSEGVIAQEVATLYPHAAGTDERGWMFVRYDILDAMLDA